MSRTSLEVGTNVNPKLITRWVDVVVQREAVPAPHDRNVGDLHTVSNEHPLGSSQADLHVSAASVAEPRKPEAGVLAHLTGYERPEGRLLMTERTRHQPVQQLRPTSYFDAHCAAHLNAPAAAPRQHAAAGRSAPVPAALENLTAAQLERVQRFGVVPEHSRVGLKAASPS